MHIPKIENPGVRPEELNILHYWRILKRATLLLVALTGISALVGISAAFIMKPVHEAAVTMVPVEY